jgi:outer membrane murein-binding lipoprotein Lpp
MIEATARDVQCGRSDARRARHVVTMVDRVMAVGAREAAGSLILLLALGLVGACSQFVDTQQELAQCRQELNDTKAKVESIRSRFETFEAERANLEADVKRLREQFESLQMEAERAKLLAEKEMLERRIAENEAAQAQSKADPDAELKEN